MISRLNISNSCELINLFAQTYFIYKKNCHLRFFQLYVVKKNIFSMKYRHNYLNIDHDKKNKLKDL